MKIHKHEHHYSVEGHKETFFTYQAAEKFVKKETLKISDPIGAAMMDYVIAKHRRLREQGPRTTDESRGKTWFGIFADSRQPGDKGAMLKGGFDTAEEAKAWLREYIWLMDKLK